MYFPKDYSHPLNQLYHPTGQWPQDSQNIVYVSKILNTTKFTPILLKEWFYLLKKKGYLIIDYYPNHLCDWQKLEEFMWWLWKGKYQIIFHNIISQKESKNNSKSQLNSFIKSLKNKDLFINNNQITNKQQCFRFICQKNVSTIIRNDSINKWSFGIITNGKRPDWLKDIIDSIRIQKIPHYEIIICGEYNNKSKSKDIIYIPFNQRNNKGWITKKKNLIIQKAKYQNICLLHDRIFLNKNWFQEVKKWGNCFDVLTGKTIAINGEKNLEHICFKGLSKLTMDQLNHFKYFPCGNLDYRDWDKDLFSYSANFMIKKYILINNPYNETLYHKDFEDLFISQENNQKGFIIRMCPQIIHFMKAQTVPFHLTYFEYNDQKLGKLKNLNLPIIIGFYLFRLFGFKRNNPTVRKITKFLSKFIK